MAAPEGIKPSLSTPKDDVLNHYTKGPYIKLAHKFGFEPKLKD